MAEQAGLLTTLLRLPHTMPLLALTVQEDYDCGSMVQAAQTEIFTMLKEMEVVVLGDHKLCLYRALTILR